MRGARPASAILIAALLCCAVTAYRADSPTSAAVAQPDGCAAARADTPGSVPTDHGAISGRPDGGVTAFLGIPYVAAPVGDLRFRPPAEPPCRHAVLEATAFGPACPQMQDGRVIGDEDCLTLNVWRPDGPVEASRPVMVFLHGGANVQGSAGQQGPDGTRLYDGARLADLTGAVVVTLNYRLGPLGFLVHPALSAESGGGVSGNYGILDQIAALRWVQRNVAGFGGDPARVLIFGESAGAVDVCALLASPLAAGLFSAALMQSGSCVQPAMAARAEVGGRVATGAGCADAADVAACLRDRSVEEILTAEPLRENPVVEGMPEYGPVVDGWVLPVSPLEALRAGTHNHVPFVVGSNADETGQAAPRIATEAEYRALVTRSFGALAPALLAQYPAGAYATPRQAFVALTSDARFTCPARTIARAAARGQDAPVYRYFFTHALDQGAARVFGAFHGLELLFVFGNLGFAGYTPTAAERALAETVAGYWSRLAATGDPNGAGAVTWPRYDPATDPYQRLDTQITAAEGVRSEQCDFWDRVLAGVRGP